MASPVRPVPCVAQRTITIENGDVIPIDKEVWVLPGAIVKFSNLDPSNYIIRFLLFGQDRRDPFALHPDIDLFLPAYGSATMLADPCILEGQCDYILEEKDARLVGRGFTRESLDNLQAQVLQARAEVQSAASSESNAAPSQPLLAMRSTSHGGGGGGTVHIGG